MAATASEPIPVAKPSRVARLRAATDKIRAKVRWRDPQRWLMIAGAFALLAGLGSIALAWYGAAHTPFLFEQIPYLISGGLLGLGLAFVGGFLYFTYWLTRMLSENREHSRRLEETLEQIRDALHPASTGNGIFVATVKGTMFHRDDCRLVAGRADVHAVSASEPGLKPCEVCKPLVAR
jgi:hypothetical protein